MTKRIIKKGHGTHLIPVHINKARDYNYFWDWSKDKEVWIKGKLTGNDYLIKILK